MRRIIPIMLLIVFSCNSEKFIKGEYKAVSEDAIIESVTFDGEVATFGGASLLKLMPALNYKVKNNKIYMEAEAFGGILVFDIIDSNTIKGNTSIFKGDVYKK